MNDNRPMEVHYIDTGFPYTVTESFMNFFDGFHEPVNHHQPESQYDQENAFWSMINLNANKYEFSFSSQESTYAYSHFEVNDHLPRTDISRRVWDFNSTVNPQDHATADTHSGAAAASTVHVMPEECIQNHQSNNSSQVIWQDNVDPDSMTYEELVDLGEAVGTQSRGIPQELINLLPTSKCKLGGFFSRKKSESCVICMTRYKRGDRQITLPCKHVYHSKCITKWLSINRVCPVCQKEVVIEDSKH